MSQKQKRSIYFSGRVQGVGFRYTSQRIARRLELDGFVRNLSDGRVELVAEGSDQELDQLIDEIRLQMRDNIDSIDQHAVDATGQFQGFDIRY